MTEKHSGFTASCSKCALQRICFANGVHDSDLDRLEDLVDRKPSVVKGEMLFTAGDNCQSIYAIRAGMIKVFSYAEDSQVEVIHGFYLPGDIVGLDALAFRNHQFFAVALDTTSVCEIPFNQLSKLATQVPSLNSQIFSLMSNEIVASRLHSTMLTQKTAEQRLADFILGMSEKFKSRGYEYSQFRLNILHRDVANYLNLTPETVSRILSKFQKDKLVTWKKKEVMIHNEVALHDLAGAPTLAN